MNDGPDFICIGQPKAATGWLYDQLFHHPGFWMPPAKELSYLNQDAPNMGFIFPERREKYPDRWNRDQRDVQFLEYARGHRRTPRNLDIYAGLFAFKGGKLSGDISPMYCLLEGGTIEEVAARFPRTRILFIVRDPVERAWSRMVMAQRDGLLDRAVLEDKRLLRLHIRDEPKVGGIMATQIVARWRRHAPHLPFRTILFDDIVGNAQESRRGILEFLGADPEGGGLPPEHNRKADDERIAMNDAARALLVKRYAGELRAGADLFGGAARGWPARYGL